MTNTRPRHAIGKHRKPRKTLIQKLVTALTAKPTPQSEQPTILLPKVTM